MWLHKKGFRLDKCVDPVALVRMVDGDIRAVIVYENFNGFALWAHVISDGSKQWMSKRFLHDMFDYPFRTLGAKKIFGRVPAKNTAALHLDFRLGFQIEGYLKNADGDGGSAYILAMDRRGCKWL